MDLELLIRTSSFAVVFAAMALGGGRGTAAPARRRLANQLGVDYTPHRAIAGVGEMRTLLLVVAPTLLLALLSPPGLGGAPPFIGVAMAQTPDALYLKCRKAVFKQYGRRGTKYGAKKRLMPSTTAVQSVDQCVANGGRV